MNCKARIIDNHRKINIESNLKKKTCSSPKVVLPILPKKISKRVRLHHDFHVMNQWRLLWHLNLHLNSRFFLAKREEGVRKNPFKSPGFPRKNPQRNPASPRPLKDKRKSLPCNSFFIFFQLPWKIFTKWIFSSFLDAFWTFLGFQPQRGGQPNKTKKNKHRLTSKFRRHQTMPSPVPKMCPTNPSDIMIHRHLPAKAKKTRNNENIFGDLLWLLFTVSLCQGTSWLDIFLDFPKKKNHDFLFSGKSL